MMQLALQNSINKKTELLEEKARRATFKSSWVFSDDVKCNADKMAEAGFIYVGTRKDPDLVQCFLCGKSLDSWEPEDDPWSEHLKHAPNCAFAALQKPEIAMTLGEAIDLRQKLTESCLRLHFKKEKDEFNKVTDQILDTLKSFRN